MQRALFLLALVVAPAVASTVGASSAATAWLKSHKSPTDDQLGDLKNANPEAFAIVNALLSKHAKHATLSAEERGPDVFRRMMAQDTSAHLAPAAEPSVALPYAAADTQPAVVDQANYNVNAAADRDESSVDRLLNAVASMGGKKGSKIALLRSKRHHKSQQADNALMADADMFGAPAQAAPVQAVEAAAAAAVEVQPAAVAAPAKKKNSYLDGIDLSGDMPEVAGAKTGEHKVKSEGANLAAFSFDDAETAAATPAPVKVEAPKPKKDNSFLKWLGLTKKAPAPVEDKAAAPAEPAKKNSYLNFMD